MFRTSSWLEWNEKSGPQKRMHRAEISRKQMPEECYLPSGRLVVQA